MSEFDPNDWQGRRKEQVEYNEIAGMTSVIVFIIVFAISLALKSIV